jgi:hypothetical protein
MHQAVVGAGTHGGRAIPCPARPLGAAVAGPAV